MTTSIPAPRDPTNIAEEATKFLNYLAIFESASTHTLRAYAVDLEQAFGLKKFGRLRVLADEDGASPVVFQSNGKSPLPILAPEMLLRTARTAQSHWGELSPASRNRKSACLKSFFNWLFKEGWIDLDLGSQITAPRVPVRLPHFLSLDEALALMASLESRLREAPESEKTLCRQQYALILLLYGGGLRVSEACALKRADVRARDGVLKVVGKGGKERLVAAPTLVFNTIGLLPVEEGPYIFGATALDTRKAYSWVREAGRRANLLKPLHPHALRHSFATHLLASGANLRALQELLGHSTLQATQKYTHVSIDQLARTLERHHPLSNDSGTNPKSSGRRR